ncbi:hypothetical protein GCHA_0905 [Paraglaciecola chathamensis S18K6]|uniref:Uncharacterized protein n=1 Tax=Paraglaciecola chathamensis S18K6 TaxID=1127672 RepID=A0AAV3UVA9_9ALTE|nr:hypothetical protein GCHA_0905 [Paraglaciecola chathamensis S18K6]
MPKKLREDQLVAIHLLDNVAILELLKRDIAEYSDADYD